MDKNYGGIIWTNHALQRMQERKVKQGDAWATWKRPTSSEYNKYKDVWVYQRVFGSEQIEVVAKKNEKGLWLILSVWSKPYYNYTPKKSRVSILSLLKDLFLPKRIKKN